MDSLHRQVGGRCERRKAHLRPLLVERPRIAALSVAEPITLCLTDAGPDSDAQRPANARADTDSGADADPDAHAKEDLAPDL